MGITRIGLYSRKSKYTEKGLSIQNQIDECRDYIRRNFEEGSYEVKIYQDEGISGKDFERPQMQQLLEDIAADRVDVLVCYRLDRVSRSVRDFSRLIDDLQDKGKEFISVKESFDTRTPIGRAMLMIASVFSQLERETIAERITDNLYALAKTGRWLGGNTPLGFESEKVVEEDGMGKRRSRYRLIPIPEEQELVKLIFIKYMELGSLTKLETFLMNAGYRTKKNNKFYGRYVLRSMLTNPVYCIADTRVFSYMKEHQYGIYSEESHFDGEHGLIAYNKINNTGKNQRRNEVKDWVVAVGEHRGFIDSALWIRVQDRIAVNETYSYRQPKRSDAVLSGIVRCANCGSLMRPKSSRRAKDGTLRFSYVCELKERSRGQLCQMPNILGQQMDAMIIEEILRLKNAVITEYGFLEKELDRLEVVNYRQTESVLLKKQIESNQKQLDSLLNALGKSTNETTTDSILSRMDQISREQAELQKRFDQEQQSASVRPLNIAPEELLAESILTMDLKSFTRLPAMRKKQMLETVVKEIIWDGENAEVHLWAEDLPEIQTA